MSDRKPRVRKCDHGIEWDMCDVCKPAPSELAPARGSAMSDELIIAFVQGAQWWEYYKTGATMWPSDRDVAEAKAECKALDGTLGKSPNVKLTNPAAE